MNHPVDIATIFLYLAGVVFLGLWVSRKHRRNTGEAGDYFLAGRTLRWPVIGLALFATNISCVHLVSLAQSGFDTGLLNGNFEWMAAFTLLILALFFAPIYLRSGATTLPDFLERRYDRACRDWLTVLSIFSAIIIHIGFSFLTGGRMIKLLFPEIGSVFLAIVIIAALTGLYTIIGGLLAVVVTETLQTVVLLIGAATITTFAFIEIGGWTSFTASLAHLGEGGRLSMLRPHGDPSGMPWYAILLGYPVIGIWYWCADQTIVQRVLGARDENHARGGALFCALLKVFPVFIFVLPGVFAYVLASQGKLDTGSLQHWEGGRMIVDSKDIYAVMITQLLPVGLRGLVLAALLAALMSSVAGALNSISTLVSYDLFERWFPGQSEHRLVSMGRIAAGAALVISIALVPLLDLYGSIFNGLNEIIAHLAPPVTCVFLLGVLWRGATPLSARWTLWAGSALGAGVFAVNKLLPHGPLAQIPFMLMAFYLLLACMAFQVLISLIRPSKNEEPALCWSNPLAAFRAPGWPGLADYRLTSAGIFLLFGILYFLFA